MKLQLQAVTVLDAKVIIQKRWDAAQMQEQCFGWLSLEVGLKIVHQ
jgi:hypothetical protein